MCQKHSSQRTKLSSKNVMRGGGPIISPNNYMGVNVYIYIHIHAYTYIYIHYLYTYIYIYIHYTYIYIHTLFISKQEQAR